MISRYRGKVGEYLWEKERERWEKYKDRPWELQSRNQTANPLFALVVVIVVAFSTLFLLSLL